MESERWRRLLTLVLALGAAGTATELVLLGHYEEWRQWLPLVLLAAGLVAALAQFGSTARLPAVVLRIVSLAIVLSGFLGTYFHLESNVAFELEREASASGLALAWEGLTGAMPALAPGAMILLGLLGLLIAAGHPAVSHRRNKR